MKIDKVYPWVVVALLWVVALLNYMDRQMLSTMRESMQVDIPQLKSAMYFGKLMAVFLWIYGIAGPFAGAISDRLNRKWLIVGSLAVWSLVTLLMGCVKNYDLLYLLRAIMGFSEALYIPAGLSLIADYHEGKSRSLAIGIHMTGLYVGQAAGGFGATLASAFTWNSAFIGFGTVGVVYAIVLVIFLREKRSTEKKEYSLIGSESVLKSFSLLLCNVAFWAILFYFATISLPGWASKNWLPTLFAETLGIPMSKAGPMATFTLAGSSFVGVIIGGILSDRWVKVNLRGRVYTLAIGLALSIPGLFLLGFGKSAEAVILSGLCFGIGYGMLDANHMPILCQFVPTHRRAAAYGIMNMLGVFAGAYITDILGKMTDDGNLGKGFSILAAMVFVALVVSLITLRPKTDNVT